MADTRRDLIRITEQMARTMEAMAIVGAINGDDWRKLLRLCDRADEIVRRAKAEDEREHIDLEARRLEDIDA